MELESCRTFIKIIKLKKTSVIFPHRLDEMWINLAKLDDGLDESPTVMVGDKTQNKKNRQK